MGDPYITKMKTMHKYRIVSFLAVSVLVLALIADPASAQHSAPEPVIILTPAEKAWLTENPRIRLATLTNQPPFSMMDADGSHTGILADLLERLSAAIGQKIAPELVEQPISDTHEVAKQDGIYGSASILKTSRHANAYLLSDAFLTTPFYIYTTTENHSDIRQPADLSGKRVAVPRNHRAVAGYLAEIGGVQTLLADTPLEQMRMVANDQRCAGIDRRGRLRDGRLGVHGCLPARTCRSPRRSPSHHAFVNARSVQPRVSPR